MKRIILIIFIGISLFSCKKKAVKLPLVAMNGEEEIANHSAIWFFYGDQGKLDLNEHNRISSTNWFFNIDKKLTLKEVMPQVIRLVIKHNEKSPHNTKPMKNYFTYINTTNKHLSYYQFDSIKYQMIKKSELPSFKKDTLVIKITNSNIYIPEINDSISVVQPVFMGHITFQDYLSSKAALQKRFIKPYISKKEYIVIE